MKFLKEGAGYGRAKARVKKGGGEEKQAKEKKGKEKGDCTLVCDDGSEVSAFKAKLSGKSIVFKEMFQRDKTGPYPIHTGKAAAVYMLKHINDEVVGKWPENAKDVVDILEFACRFKIEPIRTITVQHLAGHVNQLEMNELVRVFQISTQGRWAFNAAVESRILNQINYPEPAADFLCAVCASPTLLSHLKHQRSTDTHTTSLLTKAIDTVAGYMLVFTFRWCQHAHELTAEGAVQQEGVCVCPLGEDLLHLPRDIVIEIFKSTHLACDEYHILMFAFIWYQRHIATTTPEEVKELYSYVRSKHLTDTELKEYGTLPHADTHTLTEELTQRENGQPTGFEGVSRRPFFELYWLHAPSRLDVCLSLSAHKNKEQPHMWSVNEFQRALFFEHKVEVSENFQGAFAFYPNGDDRRTTTDSVSLYLELTHKHTPTVWPKGKKVKVTYTLLMHNWETHGWEGQTKHTFTFGSVVKGKEVFVCGKPDFLTHARAFGNVSKVCHMCVIIHDAKEL
eukprot:GDKI01030230.1.p1 GENE.GDKI01030230.1~~GDKI01030230.1.p1  ORF type:complete len:508 (+),score=171.43 GDKI01030230.1:48-1571(+)